MSSPSSQTKIAIIGMGISGLSCLFHCVRLSLKYNKNVLIEIFKGPHPIDGGYAFSPLYSHPSHLANLIVPALDIFSKSDYKTKCLDSPTFAQYLSMKKIPFTYDMFPTRILYGQYVTWLFYHFLDQLQSPPFSQLITISIIDKYVDDITVHSKNILHYSLHQKDSKSTLQKSNLLSSNKFSAVFLCAGSSYKHFHKPMFQKELGPFDPQISSIQKNALIIGSGLTAVDVIKTLTLSQNYTGNIFYTSKSGHWPLIYSKYPKNPFHIFSTAFKQSMRRPVSFEKFTSIMDNEFLYIDKCVRESNPPDQIVSKSYSVSNLFEKQCTIDGSPAKERLLQSIRENSKIQPFMNLFIPLYQHGKAAQVFHTCCEPAKLISSFWFSKFMKAHSPMPYSSAIVLKSLYDQNRLIFVPMENIAESTEGVAIQFKNNKGEIEDESILSHNIINATGQSADPSIAPLYSNLVRSKFLTQHPISGVCTDPPTGRVSFGVYSVGIMNMGDQMFVAGIRFLERLASRAVEDCFSSLFNE